MIIFMNGISSDTPFPEDLDHRIGGKWKKLMNHHMQLAFRAHLLGDSTANVLNDLSTEAPWKGATKIFREELFLSSDEASW